ncbi:ABC transporter ATP-binding protein [Ferrovum sp. PN-J185]|uniref:ABC transporter ATP-binding protein n=1 Tax=Ferrovum sp. PN-J185 TaxID=1356306 RepID=UPI00079562B1|nr:ABC transporter ATP-binding protein [Ferrovum sp. PN-J185]KXW56366.1 macrolide export ATP-binding/permease protein MacB [Ferrovum sp. PN-J185]MCC6069090.1 ABC transporter ATP-binding protein [Ferrovum sp. PN-J185]MDE1890930.1 ABC transporter ATP-binding protein [Betaproteobacteria bacterium]MDE2055758.1 ABC transporter ATP-binding protein [Betaproteobacteria bacterium]
MNDQAAAVEVSHINKWFGESSNKTYAVRDTSFIAKKGEILFIVGPSGSGKTTLLSIISGILRPDNGKVVIDGKDIWALNEDQLAEFRLNKIGFVFQDYHLFHRLSTLENVAIPLILQHLPWHTALTQARQYLDVVGLTGKEHLPPRQLSGGEQQRVAIARAIVSQPDLLILDEPTASLDGETGRKIVGFIKEKILTRQRAIIIVTHDARIIEYADKIMHMEDGKNIGIERVEHAQ